MLRPHPLALAIRLALIYETDGEPTYLTGDSPWMTP